MRWLLCVMMLAACALADEDRKHKLPFVVDAVGNALPSPSDVPATVGSPVKLITPDRYEFYTFDESGELVKRLMTLEEIQALVAAGDETDGMVTFASNSQPTVAFNFSQPPFNKVHNVVTNVQNVLKAQMEAHKNKPYVKPTLDTPDVSDSWSLILPSIFGNTGVDIVPDKSTGSFSTPETEMIEILQPSDEENSLSKEGDDRISLTTFSDPKKTTMTDNTVEKLTTTGSTMTTTTTTTTTTTQRPTTTAKRYNETTPKFSSPPTKSKTTTAINRPRLTTTTSRPRSTTTSRPRFTTRITTSSKPKNSSYTTFTSPRTSSTTTTKPQIESEQIRTSTTFTSQPRTTTTSTTKVQLLTSTTTSAPKLSTTSKSVLKSTPKSTSTTVQKPVVMNKKTSQTTQKPETVYTRVHTIVSPTAASSTEKNVVYFETKSTYVPVSTVSYITTKKPTEVSTKSFINDVKQSENSVSSSVSTTQKGVTSTHNLFLSTELFSQTQPVITTYKPTTSFLASSIDTTTKVKEDKVNATTITTQSVSPSTTVSSTEFMTVQNSQSIKKQKPSINQIDSNNTKVNEQVIPLFDVSQSISQIAFDLGNSNYQQAIPTTSEEQVSTTTVGLESKESLELDIPIDIKQTIDQSQKTTTLQPDLAITTMQPLSESKTTTEFFSTSNIKTTVGSDPSMDIFISESMENVMSQIVNQPPQSLIETNDSKKTSVTESSSFKEQEKTTDQSRTTEFTTTEHIIPSTTAEKFIATNKKTVITQNVFAKPTEYTTSTQKNTVVTIMSSSKKPVSNEINQDYIPISVLSQANRTNAALMNKPKNDTIVAPPLNTTQKNKIVFELQNKVTTSTITPKYTSTIGTLITTLSPNNSNNTNIKAQDTVKNSNQNLTSVNKVDEFKKKVQKVNIDDQEFGNERNNSWKLVSTVTPPKNNEIPKDKIKPDSVSDLMGNKEIIFENPKENQGLEVTTKDLGEDVLAFTELCNELAFQYWSATAQNIDVKRSFVLSPYSITSMLAMIFMGARGSTSGEMNDILKLDDMVTFNPHFTLKNISDSIETSPDSGVFVSAFVRELYSERTKGRILSFYKERALHFYSGHVEEVNFKLISDIIRRRTNLLVKRYTWGKVTEFMKTNSIVMQPPLAAFSTNIFQIDCSGTSVEGRDGEMYFVVSPNVRQRRLVPVPAVVYKNGFLAGYDPVLDATAAALGKTSSVVSTIFVMPGQQGNIVNADDLEALEKRLLESNPTTPAWNRLLRTLLPRAGLELQIPRFSHKSIFNVSSTLKKMGLNDLFDQDHADLSGINGPSIALHVSDMIQLSSFVTCGEGGIGEQHHIEEYPETLEATRRRRTSRWMDWDEPRDYQRAFHDPHDVGEAMHLPLHLRPRQARLPARNAQPARLKFDRPFLYFVRHNPSGMILYVGRYNPRLLP